MSKTTTCFFCRRATAELIIERRPACESCGCEVAVKHVRRAAAKIRRPRLERELREFEARRVDTVDEQGRPGWFDPRDGTFMTRPLSLLEFFAAAA